MDNKNNMDNNIIDSNMSDSQIGGRKGKNVRNHTWVLNGIICDVLSTKTKTPVHLWSIPVGVLAALIDASLAKHRTPSQRTHTL